MNKQDEFCDSSPHKDWAQFIQYVSRGLSIVYIRQFIIVNLHLALKFNAVHKSEKQAYPVNDFFVFCAFMGCFLREP